MSSGGAVLGGRSEDGAAPNVYFAMTRQNTEFYLLFFMAFYWDFLQSKVFLII